MIRNALDDDWDLEQRYGTDAQQVAEHIRAVVAELERRGAASNLRTTNTNRKATTMPHTHHTQPAMAGEPTCGQPTPNGPCWKVAGHDGPCQ